MAFNPYIIDPYRLEQLYLKLLRAPEYNSMRLRHKNLSKCIEDKDRACKLLGS